MDVRKATKETLLAKWHQDFKSNPETSSLILAFSNKDVTDLNAGARSLLKKSGHIEKEEILYKTAKETQNDFGKRTSYLTEKAFSKGDRIVFTKNNYGLNVKNGTLGTIVELNKSLITIKVEGEDRMVSLAPNLNPFFDHGWAMTIHKAQGTTTDKTYVLASYDMSKNLTYVAMTRHREDVQVFGSSIDFWRKEKLPDILSTSGEKLAARDYLDSGSLKQLMQQEDKLLSKVFTRISDELEAMGAVSKQAFRKVADHFLGRAPDPERELKTDIPKSIREETRAEKLLSQKSMEAQKVEKVYWWETSSSPSHEAENTQIIGKNIQEEPKKFWQENHSTSRQTKGNAPIAQKDREHDHFENKAFEEMSRYIEERLQHIETYAGTSLAHKAQDELHRYMTTLEEHQGIFQALHAYNPRLIQQAQEVFKEQDHHLEHNHEKGMDFGL